MDNKSNTHRISINTGRLSQKPAVKPIVPKKPGTEITHPDGTKYVVSPSGAWIRTTARRHETAFRKGMTKSAIRRNKKRMA